jgi:hypothetical protein
MSISSIPLDDLTKAKIVYMILNKRTEEALGYLSNLYNIVTPKIAVGTIRQTKNSLCCICSKRK